MRPFGLSGFDIVKPLVRMAEDGVTSTERPVVFMVEGDPGELKAEVATSLAVATGSCDVELSDVTSEDVTIDTGSGDTVVRTE